MKWLVKYVIRVFPIVVTLAFLLEMLIIFVLVLINGSLKVIEPCLLILITEIVLVSFAIIYNFYRSIKLIEQIE